jgi:hypothetical protein
MRQRIYRYCLALCALGFSSGSAAADESIVGLWSFDSCANFESIEFQGLSIAVFTGDIGLEYIKQEILPVEGTDWLLLRTDPTDPEPSLAKRDGEDFVHAWSAKSFEQLTDTQALHQSMVSGALTPDTTPTMFDVNYGQRCEHLPFPQSVMYGEAFEVLTEVDAALTFCATKSSACSQLLFEAADVTRNGELSPAEIARFIRAGFALDFNEKRTVDQIVFEGAGLALRSSRAFVDSLDTDASGTLSFAELWEERMSLTNEATPQDPIEWLTGITEAAVSMERSLSTKPQ